MQTMNLNIAVKKIDLMAARAILCQSELSEDYYQFVDPEFITVCHSEAGAKNDIIGDYLNEIREVIRGVLKELKQEGGKECQD